MRKVNTCIDPEKTNTIRKVMEGSVSTGHLKQWYNITVKVLYYDGITKG